MHAHKLTQQFTIHLEPSEVKQLSQIGTAIERAGGVVLFACAVRGKVIYAAPASLEAELATALGGQPGDRVS